jgi:hypothetical protein
MKVPKAMNPEAAMMAIMIIRRVANMANLLRYPPQGDRRVQGRTV